MKFLQGDRVQIVNAEIGEVIDAKERHGGWDYLVRYTVGEGHWVPSAPSDPQSPQVDCFIPPEPVEHWYPEEMLNSEAV
jgi:hypothetical protein